MSVLSFEQDSHREGWVEGDKVSLPDICFRKGTVPFPPMNDKARSARRGKQSACDLWAVSQFYAYFI